MKLLTIVIPHYNSPNLLKTLLDSIPSTDEIEVIVVDDKSNKYLDVYRRLTTSEKYRNVIFINNETEKKGGGVSRNIGIDKASGKWILFADADDYFVPGFYSKIKKYFPTNQDVIYFKFTSVYCDTGQAAERHIRYHKIIDDYLAGKDIKSELALRYLYPSPCGKMISRVFIEENGIRFDEVMAANDVMFSTKVGYHMKDFEVANQIIYCVTKGKGSLTMNIDEKIYDIRLQVFISYYKFLKSELPREKFELLNINGLGKILDVSKYKLGFKKIFFVIRELRKNNIKLFDLRIFNPFLIIKKLVYRAIRLNREKKYMNK